MCVCLCIFVGVCVGEYICVRVCVRVHMSMFYPVKNVLQCDRDAFVSISAGVV